MLRIAVSKIGMPYVWGGTTDGTEDGLEHGGYDCSGFAWRVYKVSGLPWGSVDPGPHRGRTGRRNPQGGARPAAAASSPPTSCSSAPPTSDSKATEANVTHEGIALSSEWAIHSSSQGVYVLPLDSGWLASSFAWARRVIH